MRSFPFYRGPPGDLYVYLDIEEIPEIQRDGINLLSSISISYLDAILGTVAKVNSFLAFSCHLVIYLYELCMQFVIYLFGWSIPMAL